MKTKKLGKKELSVSALGFGCMGMSQFYGQTNDIESLEVLNTAFNLGINFYDTSDIYGSGHNEELLSKFIKDKRSKIKLATKFGIKGRDSNNVWIVDNSPKYIKESCDSSLRRLGTDYIDLYYVHRFNPASY